MAIGNSSRYLIFIVGHFLIAVAKKQRFSRILQWLLTRYINTHIIKQLIISVVILTMFNPSKTG
jgi:hypothetical protein